MNHTSPAEKFEQIHQLALVGQAALQTNLTAPHIDQAVAILLDVISDLSADAADSAAMQDQNSEIAG
ncbi:MAG: hypothetical protein GY701_12680 [Sulfitobacter sp.]|nr:hypothetical protein [Sulfitobacter sp.]